MAYDEDEGEDVSPSSWATPSTPSLPTPKKIAEGPGAWVVGFPHLSLILSYLILDSGTVLSYLILS